jgi:hypothetical protein
VSHAPVELLAKVDNDTLVPPDMLRRLAECHMASDRFGALAGFHFRAEGEALIDASHIDAIDGVRVVRQRFVGGCAVMIRKSLVDRLGPIPCQADGQTGPFIDGGWTAYQERMTEAGLVSGYVWPLVHVDHMEDLRSAHCIRTPEHQAYKQAERRMSLEQFTQALCVWRPHWEASGGREPPVSDGSAERGARNAERETAKLPESRDFQAQDQRPKTNEPSIANCKLKNANCKLTDVPPATPCARPTNDKPRMVFTQDFRRDFDQIDFHGRPFALARFADGELAICKGRSVEGADGWNYAGGASAFRDALLAALHYRAPDYYLGLSDGCCDAAAKQWYLSQINVPLEQVTFSNIFVNANYRRFVAKVDLDEFMVVAPEGGDLWVPQDAMNCDFDIDGLVTRLLDSDRPILVSAGPAACVIVHKYWLRASPDRRRSIIDVGSAIDELTKGRKTRQYQVPGTRTAELVCRW